ncbi:DUF962-domain-containing protein [Gloeopeniophorella convolvens]|nr:DUF962-domain-containing protein [Gloeopeniophorella convolvens]
MAFSAFDVRKQLAFYGAYHNNPVNIFIHILCVPLILWSAQVLLHDAPKPTFLPQAHYRINEYLAFDVNYGTMLGLVYLAYYYLLEPVAALIYTPQALLTILTANAFAQRVDHITVSAVVHGVCWIAQFIGHGAAEGRSPALLDNIVGAVVLAPFFVHLEILFMLGYRPDMYRQLRNDVGVEITRVRKAEAEKKRATEKRAL